VALFCVCCRCFFAFNDLHVKYRVFCCKIYDSRKFSSSSCNKLRLPFICGQFLIVEGSNLPENHGSLLEEIPVEFWPQLFLRQDHILADSLSIVLLGVGRVSLHKGVEFAWGRLSCTMPNAFVCMYVS